MGDPQFRETKEPIFLGLSAKRIFMVPESRAMPGEQVLQANKEIKNFKWSKRVSIGI